MRVFTINISSNVVIGEQRKIQQSSFAVVQEQSMPVFSFQRDGVFPSSFPVIPLNIIKHWLLFFYFLVAWLKFSKAISIQLLSVNIKIPTATELSLLGVSISKVGTSQRWKSCGVSPVRRAEVELPTWIAHLLRVVDQPT